MTTRLLLRTFRPSCTHISTTRNISCSTSCLARTDDGRYYKKLPPTEMRRLTPFMQWVRDTFLGRDYIEMGRYEQVANMPPSAKKEKDSMEGHVFWGSQPLPKLPKGTANKIAFNDYQKRDGKRMSKPPYVVYDARTATLPSSQEEVKQVESGSGDKVTKPIKQKDSNSKNIYPGFGYDPDSHTKVYT